MYTPIIAQSDMSTVLYGEKITAITRGDSTIAPKAISVAISEMQMYLQRFNLIALFGDPVGDTAATINDEYRNSLCKDIAAWHLVRLANVGSDLTLIRTGYEDAIASLKRIQRLEATPSGWPLLDLNTVTATAQGNSVAVKAYKKRSNRF